MCDMDWMLDFARRCIEAGTDVDRIMRGAGYDGWEITAAMRGRQLSDVDRALLDGALASYIAPHAADEPDPEPDPVRPPAPPEICDGDKLHCPYLTRVGCKGYCAVPRCIWGGRQ